MALEFRPVEVIFRGLGEHSDPKTQIAGELSTCENAVFTKAGRVSKRRGYQLVPVDEDIEGGAVDPYNLLLNAAALHGEAVVFGYDTLYSLVVRTGPFGSGYLARRGPTFRGNVAVFTVAVAPLAE